VQDQVTELQLLVQLQGPLRPQQAASPWVSVEEQVRELQLLVQLQRPLAEQQESLLLAQLQGSLWPQLAASCILPQACTIQKIVSFLCVRNNWSCDFRCACTMLARL